MPSTISQTNGTRQKTLRRNRTKHAEVGFVPQGRRYGFLVRAIAADDWYKKTSDRPILCRRCLIWGGLCEKAQIRRLYASWQLPRLDKESHPANGSSHGGSAQLLCSIVLLTIRNSSTSGQELACLYRIYQKRLAACQRQGAPAERTCTPLRTQKVRSLYDLSDKAICHLRAFATRKIPSPELNIAV